MLFHDKSSTTCSFHLILKTRSERGMAVRSSFYAEDTVSLKANHSIIGIVESTWRDVDSIGLTRPSEWIPHSGTSEDATKRSTREGQPATGHVVVRFILPDTGCALLREEDLLLLDRALTMGDVVKRRPTDAESGMVLKAFETCLIEPLCAAAGAHSSTPQNGLLVQAEDLSFMDFEEEDRIIYNDWIGEIVETNVEVTVRLGNGTIVRVDDVDKLEVADCPRHKLREHPQQDLVSKLKHSRKKRSQATHQSSELLIPAFQFWPGQVVFTTKANLRLGTWKLGRYSANEPPQGIVVDVRVTGIQVRWIATKLFDKTRSSLEKPFPLIERSELDKVRLYNGRNFTSLDGRSSNEMGTRRMHDVGAGDIVRFYDVVGAAVKYSPDSPNKAETGVFHQIPRAAMEGFDMNAFLVRSTSTKVYVQWQNGTVTEELATNLIPYLNVDDHDVWPGEIISVKSEEIHNDEGLIELKKVGVIQAVDALERTARIRWFSNPLVSIFKDQTSVLFSGADLGQISDKESSLPLYDVMAYSALSKRRGDLVVLAPNSPSQAIHTAATLIGVSHNGHLPQLPDLRDTDLTPDPQDILSTTEVRWFGEVVDLTLNGELVIRLGALDEVEDIQVPIQRVMVAIGGDNPDEVDSESGSSLLGYGSSSDASDDSCMEYEDVEDIIEETFYEGGERLDVDGDEDDWMTDGSDFEAPETIDSIPEINANANQVELQPKEAEGEEEAIIEKELLGERVSLTTNNGLPPKLSAESGLNLSTYSSMPPQFDVLDDMPGSHHFIASVTSYNASFFRQLRREHNVLLSSLPEGIWVRTWAARLDLLQVLILGPRGTPYALAPFLFDFHLKPDYPSTPPEAYFHSWTNNIGRINPNLYEDGNICLSILGTWHHKEAGEGWNKESSNLMQVLVSLLGLVLVEQPYYSNNSPNSSKMQTNQKIDEAGFDSLIGAEETLVPARIYAEKALCLSKGFVSHAMTRGCGALTSVANWIYRDVNGPKLILLIVEETREYLDRRTKSEINNPDGKLDVTRQPLSAGAEALLRRYLPALESIAGQVSA